MTGKLDRFDSAPWYFAHIPKSGGTTFSVLFDRLFDVKEIFPHQLLWEVGHISPERSHQYKLFRGHFNALGCHLAYRQTRNVTILRNPVDMAFSSYKHICNDPNTNLHQQVVGENWSFEDFIFSPESKNVVSNKMTRFLQLGAGVPLGDVHYELNEDTFRRFRRQFKLKKGRPNIEEKFELALNYLKGCFWVGVLDELPESLDLLCYQLSLPPINEIPVLNKGTSDMQLSAVAIQHLNEMNFYDLKLLSWAKENLKSKCSKLDAQTGSRTEIMESSYQQNHCRIFHKQPQHEVQLSMDQPLIGDQWLQRQFDRKTQSYYRWSGPGNKAFIDLWLVRKSFAVEILILDHCLTRWDDLSIDANHNSIPYTITPTGDGWCLSARLCEQLIASDGLLRLTFNIQQGALDKTQHNSNINQIKPSLALKHVILR